MDRTELIALLGVVRERATLVSMDELLEYHQLSTDGKLPSYNGKTLVEKLQGGVVFGLLKKFLKVQKHEVVRLRHAAFQRSNWNNNEGVVLVVHKNYGIPSGLHINASIPLGDYIVVNQKKMDDFIKGFIRIEHLVA